MYEAARHLVDQGCDRFFYIGGPSGNYHEVERYKGFAKCMKDNAIAPRSFIARNGDFSLQGGFAVAQEFLGMQRRPNGVVCASDSMAIGFMKAARRAGMRIPDDVAVVGFDGIEFGEYCEPALTTCAQPTQKLGKAGVDLLLDMIEAGSKAATPGRTVIDSTLIVRESSVKTAQRAV
jgi:LacI family repressor for deo operon, udp, cdd, tsx, nupC, and nupG